MKTNNIYPGPHDLVRQRIVNKPFELNQNHCCISGIHSESIFCPRKIR
jgi:hypothetical protein